MANEVFGAEASVFFVGRREAQSGPPTDIVTNGDFADWTGDNPDSWTVVGEDANNYVEQDGDEAHFIAQANDNVLLRQTILEVGKVYRAVVEIGSLVSGSIWVGSAVNGEKENITTEGVHVVDFGPVTSTFFQLDTAWTQAVDLNVVSIAVYERCGCANPGGCTQAWWDGQCANGTDVEKAAAIAKLMGVNGEPAVDAAGCSFTASSKRISKAGAFGGAGVGMVAYVKETPVAGANIATGRYRITGVDTGGGWIEIGDAVGADATVDVKVGGAFGGLQQALDATDASVHNVTIFTNLDEVLYATIDADTGGGTTLQNSFKKVVGFKVVPGDISREGSLYQSALSILKAGAVDASKCVTLDVNDGAFEVLNVAVDNVVFENIQFCNTANTYRAVKFGSAPKGCVYINCRFVDVEGVYDTQADVVVVHACYSEVRGDHFNCRGYGHTVIGCVGKMCGGSAGTYVCADGTAVAASVCVEGCVCVCDVGCGDAPLRVIGSPCSVVAVGNTFYGFGGEGCQLNSGDFIIAYGNVFAVQPGGYGVQCVTSSSGAGSLIEANNCWWVTDGSSLPFVLNDANISEPPVMSVDSFEADPEFADAGSFDFRVRNAKLLRGGRSDVEGNAGQIGAVVQAYEFARRARATDPARMGVVR